MNRSQRDMVDRIEAMPIPQARLEIASGAFGDIGSPNHAFASSWLSQKEAAAREAKEGQKVIGTTVDAQRTLLTRIIHQEGLKRKRVWSKVLLPLTKT